jgi:Phage tail assembly chaperone proteins, E, or 41 or 14
MNEERPRAKTIEFITPIVVSGGEHKSIDLRPPKLGEVIKARKNADALEFMSALISLVAAVPRAVVEQMDMDQFTEAAEFVQGFTERDPTPGGV